MGIPKIVMYRPPVKCLHCCQTCHAFVYATALRISRHMFLAISIPLSPVGSIFPPEAFIYPSPVLNCITIPSLLNSSLIESPTFTTLKFISMENFTLPPTTNTTNIDTTLHNQEQTLTLGNPQRSNVINEAYSYVPSSVMSHSHFQNTSHFLQSHNQNVQFPNGYLYGHTVPVVFPAYPYQVEGSGMVNGTPNLGLRGFPDRFLSNGYVGHTVQRTCSMSPLGLSEFQKPRRSQSSITNSVRSKRKMAHQRSERFQINSSAGGSSSSNGSNGDQDLYTFCTPDNRKLRVLLRKELTNSDVGTLGRIILPKREAERNLPSLASKEGIQMVIRDVYSTRQWQMRYRFWSNYKGRMYILDQIGDFVGQNGLEIGDCLTIYEDENKDLYFSIRKIEKPTPQPSNEPTNASHSYISIPFTQEATEEEDSSLKILMEELKYTPEEEEEANNSLTTLIPSLLQRNNQQYN